MFRTFILFLSCLSLLACSTYSPVRRTSPNSYALAIKSGDQVSLTTINGQTFELKVTRISQDVLTGVDDNGRPEIIKISDIQELEKESISATKTSGGILAVVVIVCVTALALVARTLSSAGK